MTEQLVSGFALVAGLFIAAAFTGYVLLNRGDHHSPDGRHGGPVLRG